MSYWWCARHQCEKYDHLEVHEGPCPLWWVPTTWVEKLYCTLGLCWAEGTCLECDGWKEVKELFELQSPTSSTLFKRGLRVLRRWMGR